jgi:hypothetical protein
VPPRTGATLEARRQSADASEKAKRPNGVARVAKAQTRSSAPQKNQAKKRRTPKAYFDARSTTYLTYPEDINKPVNKNC